MYEDLCQQFGSDRSVGFAFRRDVGSSCSESLTSTRRSAGRTGPAIRRRSVAGPCLVTDARDRAASGDGPDVAARRAVRRPARPAARPLRPSTSIHRSDAATYQLGFQFASPQHASCVQPRSSTVSSKAVVKSRSTSSRNVTRSCCDRSRRAAAAGHRAGNRRRELAGSEPRDRETLGRRRADFAASVGRTSCPSLR